MKVEMEGAATERFHLLSAGWLNHRGTRWSFFFVFFDTVIITTTRNSSASARSPRSSGQPGCSAHGASRDEKAVLKPDDDDEGGHRWLWKAGIAPLTSQTSLSSGAAHEQQTAKHAPNMVLTLWSMIISTIYSKQGQNQLMNPGLNYQPGLDDQGNKQALMKWQQLSSH